MSFGGDSPPQHHHRQQQQQQHRQQHQQEAFNGSLRLVQSDDDFGAMDSPAHPEVNKVVFATVGLYKLNSVYP